MSLSEKEALEKLAIPSWKYLSKDKFMSFLSFLPDLDKETQFRAIEQIPNIISYITAMNEKIIEASKTITDNNKETTSLIVDSLNEMQMCFQDLLKREGLSTEDKILFSEKLMDLAKIYVELDKTNKGFLEKHFSDFLTVASVLGIGIIAWILTRQVNLKS